MRGAGDCVGGRVHRCLVDRAALHPQPEHWHRPHPSVSVVITPTHTHTSARTHTLPVRVDQDFCEASLSKGFFNGALQARLST